jgi:hypothetical protein
MLEILTTSPVRGAWMKLPPPMYIPIKGVRLSGFPAWATWLVVHLWYLIGFQNRLLVLIRWSFSFATHGRGARLITDASIWGEQRDR